MLDGEIVIDGEGAGQAFGALQQRIHPAASRIERLASEWPASYVAFDLLELDGVDLRGEPFERRREALDALAGIRRSTLVRDPAAARGVARATPRASSRSASTRPTRRASAPRW